MVIIIIKKMFGSDVLERRGMYESLVGLVVVTQSTSRHLDVVQVCCAS